MKMNIYKNPNADEFASIIEAVKANDGYCPCALEWNESTKCVCSAFRESLARGEETECHCGKYKIIKVED